MDCEHKRMMEKYMFLMIFRMIRATVTLGLLLFMMLNTQVTRAYTNYFTGIINDEQWIVQFEWEAQAGDSVEIYLTRRSGDLNPFLGIRLADSDRYEARLNSEDGRTIRTIHVFEATGTYFLQVSRLDADLGITSGGFILSLDTPTPNQLPPALDPTGTIVNRLAENAQPAIVILNPSDLDLHGTITSEKYVNYYWFYLQGNETVSIQMSRLSDDLNVNSVLIDSVGTLLVRGAPNEESTSTWLTFTASASGWYCFVATRFDIELGDTTGDYLVQFESS